MNIRNMFGVLLAATAALSAPSVSALDAWPSKPIKLTVAYSAGGSTDQLARLLADELPKYLKQPIVVENRPGASGMVGANTCKNSVADGYTFCIFLMDVVTTNPTLFKNATYKPETDFVPVGYVAESNIVVPVSTKSSIRSIKDLISEARLHPNAINWGSWGVGSSAHLVLASINKSFGTNITHIPYKDTMALITAVLTGEVTSSMAGYSLLQQDFDVGTLRPIAVLGEKRMKQLPNVPTLAEQGVPLNGSLWFGVFAPAATPRPIVLAMNSAINKVVQEPEMIKKFDMMGNLAKPMSQPDFAAFVKKQTAIWSSIARESGIVLE